MSTLDAAPSDWLDWLLSLSMKGFPREMIIARCCEKGLDEEYARLALTELVQNPLFRVCIRHLQHKAKSDSLLRVRAALDDMRDLGEIAELNGISAKRFQTDFLAANRPLVLRGIAKPLQSTGPWSFRALKERFGQNIVSVTSGLRWSDDPPFHFDPPKIRIQFGEFLDLVRQTPEADTLYLTAEDALLTQDGFEELISEAQWPSPYLNPARATPDMIKVWIGPGGTLTRLHHDRQNVLLVQLEGSKIVTLASSAHLPRMANVFGCSSRFSATSKEAARSGVHFRELTIDPGDALLIPIGWWHEVRSLGPSISISYDNLVGGESLWTGVYWIRDLN